MTRKHFESFALMFGEMLAGTDDQARRSGILAVVSRLTYTELPKHNPRFDAVRFRIRINEVETTLRKTNGFDAVSQDNRP